MPQGPQPGTPAQPLYGAPAQLPGSTATTPTTPARTSVLGIIGMALAVLGTILACIPTVVTGVIALALLFVAFVVSVIALFAKNTKKWPAIVGVVLAPVGGALGAVVLFFVLWANSLPPSPSAAEAPVPAPTTTLEESQTSDTPGADGGTRPLPEEIGLGYQELLHEGDIYEYDSIAGYFTCMGQEFYDSPLSDESVQLLADGQDLDGSERDLAISVGVPAGLKCDPDALGLSGESPGN
ncbi:hypothetical protein [Microbacterium gorillae]|uniref:hypothetical protein n=1 Tax=Microbacterium gorillae TaxID=1231063 RepID=UPI00058D8B99|nr:hypothetical protein [Microbacterium gorillae]